MKDFDNHKENTEGATAKLRAFIAGLTPAAIFRFTLATSVIVALAATIIYHTATDSKHVRISPVNTATVVLSGSDDLGGVGLESIKPLITVLRIVPRSQLMYLSESKRRLLDYMR